VTEFTVDQIEAAIPLALRDQEFTVVVALLHMMAVRAPDRTRAVMDVIGAVTRELVFGNAAPASADGQINITTPGRKP
jgi:hypothetical protein